MAVPYPITVVKGDSWPAGPAAEAIVTVYELDEFDVATEMDLTSVVTAAGAAKLRSTDTTPVATFVVTIKNQITNRGQVGFRLAADESELLTLTEHYWDLELAWDTANVLTVLGGPLTVLPSSTPTTLP